MDNDKKKQRNNTRDAYGKGEKKKLKQYNEKKKGRKKKEICNLFRTSERQNATKLGLFSSSKL